MLRKLKGSIKKSHYSAVDQDEIHYEFLKKLLEESLKFLLKIFNEIWTEENFPDIWRQTIIVPIPKPEKRQLGSTKLQTYLSCLCKTMEKNNK